MFLWPLLSKSSLSKLSGYINLGKSVPAYFNVKPKQPKT